MALDIQGSLKKTRFNANCYTFLDELFSNALDSFLIRKFKLKEGISLEVNIKIRIDDLDVSDSSQVQQEVSLIFEDNGIGFGEDQINAFVTKDTSYKDSLNIQGLSTCKGSGRMQYFRYFTDLKIESRYKDQEVLKKTKLAVSSDQKSISESDFHIVDCEKGDVVTKIHLNNIKKDALENMFKHGVFVEEAFSSEAVKMHVLVSFLHRLVSLKEVMGDFKINISSSYGDATQESSITLKDLPSISSSEDVDINIDGNNKVTLNVAHYKLDKKEFNIKKNIVALCARSAIVLDISNKYLKNKKDLKNPIKGFYHIVLVTGDYLDNRVNEQRTGYDLPYKTSQKKIDVDLADQLSIQEIQYAIEEPVIRMVKPSSWNREKVIQAVAHKYGITSAMIKDVKVHISYGDTEEKVAKRVMNHYQEKIIDDTSDIFDLKEEISQLTPDSQEFRDKLNELSWKHTSSIKNVDMANLAHLVVRRSTIVDILKMTIDGQLDCQVDNVGRNKNEALIHNIFFPMRKDTPEVKDHDIWLLNEEYSYYDYISSDKPLASVKWDGDETLFDADIDDEMAKITTQVYDENKNTRPDIAIFSKEGAAIIIEFKAPDVSLEKHTSEVVKYAKVLASKSKGKINRFYGYLIGSKIDHTALDDYSRFANDKGWFKTSSLVDYDTREHLGELYSEILFYDDVVEKASMRLKAYKDKLNPS